MRISTAPVRKPAHILIALVCAALVLLPGCTFNGIDSITLPGGKGTGDDAIKVSVELPDVGTLTTNAQVKVDDIAVGTVTSLRVDQWHAVADLSLEPDVQLPANAVARVGINTLLGAAYVELAAPAKPKGQLADGAIVPLERGHAYPTTEQVLSAASVALNGGGLEQLSTITTELNNVLGGNDRAVANLLPRLDSFVGTLDAQLDDILAAVRDVARLSRRFANHRGVITHALDQLGPALDALARNRPQLTEALTSLTNLSNVATPLVRHVKADLIANLQDLTPVLRAIQTAGNSAVSALGHAVTFPFAPETVQKACRSDYCNLMLTVDLTNSSLLDGLVRPDGSIGLPGLPGAPDFGNLLDGILSGVLGSPITDPIAGLLRGLTRSFANSAAPSPRSSDPLGLLLGGGQ